jgi:signal transduction histidine kinase
VNRFDIKTQSFRQFTHDEGDSSSLSRNSSDERDSSSIGANAHFIFESRSGTLWVGSDGGLNRFNNTGSSFTRFYPPGRRRAFIYMLEDERGRLWSGSQTGVKMFDPSTGSFSSFDQSDGLANFRVLGWSYAKLKSGEFVFGTSNGILVFHPDSVRPIAYVPPIVITGINKFNRPVRLATSAELVREFAFEHDENVFSIEFAALSYDMPGFNQYAYMLEGFDKAWVYCGNRREATYTNLDPGTYTFRVKGSNHDGVWNEAGTSLRLIVNPAFWQVWWFRVLAITLVGGLLAFAYRREVSRLRKDKLVQQEFSRLQIESQEAERKRLAAELHDGLGQNLLVASNELQKFLRDAHSSRSDLEQAAGLVQESIQAVREISSNLHPHHLDRLGFVAAVEAMAENLCRATGLDVETALDNVDDLLSKDAEIHLYRIIQEALTNVVRHASAGHARVEVKRNAEAMELTVADDGKGFRVTEGPEVLPTQESIDRSRGFGVASMSERARIIGGKLEIISSPGCGTTVHAMFPCPKGERR